MEIKQKPYEQSAGNETKLIRVLSTDIEGKMKLYPALTKIKGVSWSLANATCKILEFDKDRKIGSLNEAEIKKLTDFLKNPKIPKFLINRRDDFTTGEDKHLIGTELEMAKEFDIKRLKKIKAYRGLRHASKQPVRGQRTKAHFRTRKKQAVGVKAKKPTAETGTATAGNKK